MKASLVVTAHPGDFVWRAGGAIALHAKRGYRVKIVCLSFGERGESQFAWKQTGATLASVKAGRKEEAERAARMLGAEIEFFDCGDYPLKLNEAHFDRMVDIYREVNPSFVLTHALEDPYNFDHPDAAHFAQQTRVVAQAMGHKPDAKYQYSAPPVFLFEPHQPEMCNFKPQVSSTSTRSGKSNAKALRSWRHKNICGPIMSASRCSGACRAGAIRARP